MYVNYPLYTPETIASGCFMHLFSRCYYGISMKYFIALLMYILVFLSVYRISMHAFIKLKSHDPLFYWQTDYFHKLMLSIPLFCLVLLCLVYFYFFPQSRFRNGCFFYKIPLREQRSIWGSNYRRFCIRG